MDVESPIHLERFRDVPAIKAVIMGLQIVEPGRVVRFERAARNTAYWPPIEAALRRLEDLKNMEEIRESALIYGRPCHLIATATRLVPHAPYAIGVCASDGPPVDDIVTLFRSVTYDYWYGSTFFK